MSPLTVKDWRDDPDHTTPLTAAALEDLETRLGAYTDTQVTALGTTVTSNTASIASNTTAIATKQDAATAATDAELAAAVGPAWRAFPWLTGAYYTGYGSTGTAIPPEGQVQYSPLWIPQAAVADQIGCEVTVIGTAGAVVRVGVYSSDANGRPGTRLLDAGTVDGTSVAIKTIDLTTTPLTFPSAGLYWGAAVVQGAAGTRPTCRHTNYAMWPAANLIQANIQNQVSGYLQAGVSGALPGSATPGTMATATGVIRVWMRSA